MSEQFRDQPDDFLRRADWTFPIPIAYGPGRFGELPAHCELLNLTNPLIVTDRGTSELSFISEAIKLLESFGIRNSLFTGLIQIRLTITSCEQHWLFKLGARQCYRNWRRQCDGRR